jgi:hypothetical protein
MKKVVRLNESDIVRLVKKVISENKKMLNEAESNWAGSTIKTFDGREPFIIINNKKFKTWLLGPGKEWDLKIKSITKQPGTVYGENACITTSENQSKCFDVSEMDKLIQRVNNGETYIILGSQSAGVRLQAWQ